MRVSTRTAGFGGYNVLADDEKGEKISGYEPEMSCGALIEPLLDSPNVGVYDLGNRRWSLPLIVDRQHADEDAAIVFLVTHPIGLPNLVDVRIEVKRKTVYLVRAILNSFKCVRVDGKSTLTSYQFVGENYSDTAP